MHLIRRSFPVSSLALAALLSTAAAEPPEGEPPVVEEALPLAPWRTPAVTLGPVLAAPSDLVHDRDEGTEWSRPDRGDGGRGPRPAWLELDEPPLQQLALSGEQAQELLLALLPDVAGAVSLGSDEAGIRASGPAPLVARWREAAERLLPELAPSVRLEAALVGSGEPTLRAQGGVRLWPARWTRVWLREHRPRYPVEWDVEIAQEATVMQPVLHALPEGVELYVRWLPGETRSLLEVWSGELEHQDEVEIDLSGIRNVPEAAGCGPLRAPRTAVRRAYAPVVLPAGGGSQEITWSGPVGGSRLRLSLGAAPPRATLPAPGTGDGAEGRRLALARVGAAAHGLLFEARPDATHRLLEQLSVATSEEPEASLSLVATSGRTLLAALGGGVQLEGLARRIAREEEALVARTLALRVLTVPEEAVRGALAERTLAVAAPVPPALLERLRGAGAVEGEGVRLPLLAGAASGFRCGVSVPGLTRLDVEVAQQAGATDPQAGACFAGLSGEARLDVVPGGVRLLLEADVSWADPRGGSVTLAFRPPVGMAFNRERAGPEPDALRRVTLPTLAAGSVALDAELEFAAAEAGERLAAVAVRGSEVVLLLASLAGR